MELIEVHESAKIKNLSETHYLEWAKKKPQLLKFAKS